MVSREGAVTPASLPSLRAVYSAIAADLADLGPSLSEQQRGIVVASHASRAMFDGALAAAISDAARAVFAPDVASEHLEVAKQVLVPVVLLTDYEMTDEDFEHNLKHESFMQLNLTQVERALAALLPEGHAAIVVSAHHPLSRHKALAAALWRARVTKSERALMQRAGDGAFCSHAF
jgi:hypothetical protein